MNAIVSSSDPSHSTPNACATETRPRTGSAAKSRSWLMGTDRRLASDPETRRTSWLISALRVVAAGVSPDSYGPDSYDASGAGSSGGCDWRAAWGDARRRAEADGELRL